MFVYPLAAFALALVSCGGAAGIPQKNPGTRPGLMGPQRKKAYSSVIFTLLWAMSQARSLFRPPSSMYAE